MNMSYYMSMIRYCRGIIVFYAWCMPATTSFATIQGLFDCKQLPVSCIAVMKIPDWSKAKQWTSPLNWKTWNGINWFALDKLIASTANRSLSLLQRNIYHCPQPIKTMSYKSLVRPQLEYCSTIWDPHNKCHINQLESIQNRAARFILNDYRRFSSVTQMKSTIGLESLESRRKLNKAILFYKMQNNIVDLKLDLRPDRKSVV